MTAHGAKGSRGGATKRARRSPAARVEGAVGAAGESATETAVLERFVRSRTLEMVGLLARPEEAPFVAAEGRAYVLSRVPADEGLEEALKLLKLQGRVVTEIEGLVRELVETVRCSKSSQASPGWTIARPGAGKRLARARKRLQGLEGAGERLERILPAGQAGRIMGRLEGLTAELDMLLRPDQETRAVLAFAFGGRLMSWVCGKSREAQALIGRIEKLAPTDLPVLVCGETGTGKELAARYVHSRSRRARGPFVAINCAAIPSELLESQLFGQRAGAFTSAREQAGLLEAAEGGTFFMDEVSELSLEHQAKLLRFVEERRYIPVGGRKPRHSDARLIFATNRNLSALAGQGAFRLDLYHRINDFVIQLRPLRERPEDLPLLIDFFLRKCSGELGVELTLSEEARSRLLAHGYPGNIRELEKAIRRAAVLCEHDLISPGDLYLEGEAGAACDLSRVRIALEGLRLARRRVVVPRLLDFLRQTGGRWFSSREWARAAGLSDSQARAQLKALSAEGGPLEHNRAARSLSRYRLRSLS